MPTAPEIAAFNQGIHAVIKIVLAENAQAVIGYHVDQKLQARIEELACKSTDNRLTTKEKAEYSGYVRANKFVAVLRRQARQFVGGKFK